MSKFADRVCAIVHRIPRGRVVSYGGVAALLGSPRAARAVGGALCALPENSGVPWWRVINRNGEISIRCMIHGPQVQRALLEGEGVRFDEAGRIDWQRFGWDGKGYRRRKDLIVDPDANPVLPRAAAKRNRNRLHRSNV
jgi:methylated-DNA-protein-cysteine methyltransferase-like protein